MFELAKNVKTKTHTLRQEYGQPQAPTGTVISGDKPCQSENADAITDGNGELMAEYISAASDGMVRMYRRPGDCIELLNLMPNLFDDWALSGMIRKFLTTTPQEMRKRTWLKTFLAENEIYDSNPAGNDMVMGKLVFDCINWASAR